MDPDDWDDAIREIWEGSIGDGFLTGSDLARFTSEGADLFHNGWIESDVSPEDRQDSRDAFFQLMEEFDISSDEFDWDDWRDWYEAA